MLTRASRPDLTEDQFLRMVVAEAQFMQRLLASQYEHLDPCPMCGRVNPEWRQSCHHLERDDEFAEICRGNLCTSS